MTKTEKALRMRHQNQLNRHLGADFEELIGAACEYYRGRGVADIEKTQEEMKPIKNMGSGRFVAVYVKKAQADFKGFLRGGLAVNFEAKHTSTPRMEQDRVTPEQADRLERAFRYGAAAFVVCSFSGKDFFRVPWEVWRNMKARYGHKYITIQEAEPFRITFGGPGVLLFLEGLEEKNNGVQKEEAGKDERRGTASGARQDDCLG